jgi:LysR family transcriptional regulator, low CO2-responsive transcriptional regulator
MTLHQLRVFAKVAELQSFTEAAKALRLTQPSCSSLVQGLVRELKYKLFERRGTKIALTSEGSVLLRRAREALGIIDDTKDEIAEIHGLRKGKLSVGGSALAAASFLPVAVQRFKKKHTGLEFVLIMERSEELQKKLLQGDLDLAIIGRIPRSAYLIVEPLRDEKIVVIAPPKHPLALKRSVPLELLVKEPLITHRDGSTVRNMTERKFIEKGLTFKPFLEVNFEWSSRDAIKNVVANGLGIGFTTQSYVASDVKAGRVKLLKVPELKLKRTMYIAVHKNRRGSPLVRTFIDFLRRYYKERR